MVSFDMKSLFTNEPLEYTIDLVLKRIYDNGELSTDITRSEMKEMSTLCTKNVHFTFNNDILTNRRNYYDFLFRSSSYWNIHGTLRKISSSCSERPTWFLETIR